MKFRTEKDALGELEVPEEAYYGIHTARSLSNFNVAGTPFPLELIHAMTRLKQACAKANEELGDLNHDEAESIVTACRRVLAGEFDDQFSVDLFQAGSGTSSHMNLNEVIANIANEQLGIPKGRYSRVHPNDHVNMGQSTNNVVPSGIRIAAGQLSHGLLSSARKLKDSLHAKAHEFQDILKSGRTHLQDAVPISLGQEFGAYSRAIEKAVARILNALASLLELGVGGNAVGTGINTRPEFRKLVIEHLNPNCDLEYYPARNGIEATQFLTDIAAFSSSIKALASDVLKITNDLRLLSSGPNTGLAEIRLPSVEPGSSIMPGKVNPTVCEAANMACLQVMGNDHATALASNCGQLELNTHMPLVGAKTVETVKTMQRCCEMLAEKCIAGISADKVACRKNFESSAGLATVLNPVLGYDKVSDLVKEGLKANKTIKDLVLEKGIMKEEQLEQLFNTSTGPATEALE